MKDLNGEVLEILGRFQRIRANYNNSFEYWKKIKDLKGSSNQSVTICDDDVTVGSKTEVNTRDEHELRDPEVDRLSDNNRCTMDAVSIILGVKFDTRNFISIQCVVNPKIKSLNAELPTLRLIDLVVNPTNFTIYKKNLMNLKAGEGLR